MAKLILKSKSIRILQNTNLLIGILFLIPFIFVVNSLPVAHFNFYGEFYEFILLLIISIPSVFFLISAFSLFLFSQKSVTFAFVFSLVNSLWYFVTSILLMYVRFVFYGRCGFEGYMLAESSTKVNLCHGKTLLMNEISVFLVISVILVLNSITTLFQIIKIREENRLIVKQLKRKIQPYL